MLSKGMRPKAIAVAATLVLTAGGLSTATIGRCRAGIHAIRPRRSLRAGPAVRCPGLPRRVPRLRRPGGQGRAPTASAPSSDVAGRAVAWAYFSNNWFEGEIRFPAARRRDDRRRRASPVHPPDGALGFGAGPDPNFSMRSIAEGEWDAELDRWCAGRRGHRDPAAGRVRHRGERRLVPLERALERRRANRLAGPDAGRRAGALPRRLPARRRDLRRTRAPTTSPGSSTRTSAAGRRPPGTMPGATTRATTSSTGSGSPTTAR